MVKKEIGKRKKKRKAKEKGKGKEKAKEKGDLHKTIRHINDKISHIGKAAK